MKVVLLYNKYLLITILFRIFIDNLFFLWYYLRERIIIMDKNYYEILEIDKNASPEIIEKAYKTLAKKYDPDLQDDAHKKEAEETLKKINEAYETLSNPEKKSIYDQTIESHTISEDDYNDLYEQNQILKEQLKHTNDASNRNANTQDDLRRQEENLYYQQQLQNAREKAYHDAYIQDLKNRGYKIRYKKTFKEYVKDFIALIIFILILVLIWQIPFVRNFFIDFYNNNAFLQGIVELFNKSSSVRPLYSITFVALI